EDGIRDKLVTGVQTCALPICIRLDCDRLSPSAFKLFDNGRRCVRAFGVSDGDAGSISLKPMATMASNRRSLRAGSIGSMRAWLRSEERRVGKECGGGWWACRV